MNSVRQIHISAGEFDFGPLVHHNGIDPAVVKYKNTTHLIFVGRFTDYYV